MNKVRIVGFHGGMGSGKSTAIELLDLHSKLNLELVKFAQPLYDIQEYAYQRIASVYHRPADFVKDRKFLQWVGTEWGRDSISKTLWIDLAKTAMIDALQKSAREQRDGRDEDLIVVSDDVRFENEAEAIRAMGGVVIKIENSKRLERITTANGIKNHSSEVSLPSNLVDFTVDNNGTLDEYKDKLLWTFSELKLI